MEIKYEEFGEGMENYIYSCFNHYLILHLIKKSAGKLLVFLVLLLLLLLLLCFGNKR